MKKMTLGITSSLLLLSTQMVLSQQSVNASGGDITGSGGEVAFSVGQPFYSVNGNFSTSNEGVQQPIEVSVGVDELANIHLSMNVFPNPTNDFIHLELDDLKDQSLVAHLIDANGKLILTEKIFQTTTAFSVHDLPAGTYYLEVFVENERFKSFTLIKY